MVPWKLISFKEAFPRDTAARFTSRHVEHMRGRGFGYFVNSKTLDFLQRTVGCWKLMRQRITIL